MKRLILYDLDGTLVDTKLDIAQAVNHALKELGASVLHPDEVARFVGSGLDQLIGGSLKTHDPAVIERGIELFRTYYAKHLADYSTLYPGVREVLEYFKARTQAVITNKPNPYSKNLLSALGVASYFSDIMSGDGEYPRKPDPSAVFTLLQRDGVSASEALVIGDSPIDVEMGRRAGIFTLAVAQGFNAREELVRANPDALVDDFAAVLAFVKQQGW